MGLVAGMSEGIFLGQLQAFVEIARLGNVTRAAESLFLTQPALTSRLKRLEQELGASLLVRDRRGARLTDAGRALLPYAERALATMTEGQHVVSEVMRGLSGDLVVAATSTLSTYVLPPVIRRFATENPSVRLSMHSALSEDVLEMVLRGTAQLGLGRALQHPEVECVPLYEEEYLFAVDARHPLAAKRTVMATDLSGETLITLFRSASYREFVQNLLRHTDAPPRSVIDLDNPEAGKHMIREALGVGLFPRMALAGDLENGSLKALAIADIPPMRRTMAAIRLRKASDLSSVRELLRLLTARLRELNLSPRPGKQTHRPPVKKAPVKRRA